MSRSWPLAWLALLLVPVLVVVAAALLRRPDGGAPLRLSQVAGPALLFAALGPPLGGLLLGIAAMLVHDDPEPLTMLLFLLVMSYVPGMVPALVGGACMGALRPRLGAAARPVAAALACGATTAAFGGGVLELRSEGLWMMAVIGAASGAGLEAACLWRGRRRRLRARTIQAGPRARA